MYILQFYIYFYIPALCSSFYVYVLATLKFLYSGIIKGISYLIYLFFLFAVKILPSQYFAKQDNVGHFNFILI